MLLDGKSYPPKYVLSIANCYANGVELNPEEFRISKARRYLTEMGFTIVGKDVGRLYTV